jgi:UPF0755 protein
MMRTPLMIRISLALGTLSLSLALGIWFWVEEEVLAEGQHRAITIATGASIRQVAQQLHDPNIDIHVSLFYPLFRGLCQWRGDGRRIKSGVHQLVGPLKRWALCRTLTYTPKDPQVTVTIQEGWTRWHIADALSSAGVVDRAVLLKEIDHQDAEGELFPDTYRFRPSTPAPQVVRRLKARFQEVFDELLIKHPQTSVPLKDPQRRKALINLASFVERESALAEERPLIAQVFYNRLEAGMKLQSDPSCVYSPDLYLKRAHPSNCKDAQNLYSTYIISGLPPTPIANPGKGALEATLSPASTSDSKRILFFVSKRDGTGAHAFSETYKQHRAAVKTYLLTPMSSKTPTD